MLFEYHELLLLRIAVGSNIECRGLTEFSIANCAWRSTWASVRRPGGGTLHTNVICDRSGAVIAYQIYKVRIRRRLCMSRAALQFKSENWLACYRALRTHKQRTLRARCNGRPPEASF